MHHNKNRPIMHIAPLNLEERTSYLAGQVHIETFGLPDGASLIDLGDGMAMINRGCLSWRLGCSKKNRIG